MRFLGVLHKFVNDIFLHAKLAILLKASEDITADDPKPYYTLKAILIGFLRDIMHELLGNNQTQCAGKPNDWVKKDP